MANMNGLATRYRAKTNGVSDETLLSQLADMRREEVERGQNRGDASKTPRFLDLIAVWDGDVAELQESIESVADWGPYELAGCWRLYLGNDGKRRVLCRFFYHGGIRDLERADTRGQFECSLRNGLRAFADWEEVGANPNQPSAPRVRARRMNRTLGAARKDR